MNLRASLAGMPVLEKYELLEEIGHGGMATVYRAKDKRLGREVAVKIIHKHLRESSEVATRFTAEARAAAKLRHPNIVEVYDVSADDDRYRYLVVELIRGAHAPQDPPGAPRHARGDRRVDRPRALRRAHPRARGRHHPPRREAGERADRVSGGVQGLAARRAGERARGAPVAEA